MDFSHLRRPDAAASPAVAAAAAAAAAAVSSRSEQSGAQLPHAPIWLSPLLPPDLFCGVFAPEKTAFTATLLLHVSP